MHEQMHLLYKCSISLRLILFYIWCNGLFALCKTILLIHVFVSLHASIAQVLISIAIYTEVSSNNRYFIWIPLSHQHYSWAFVYVYVRIDPELSVYGTKLIIKSMWNCQLLFAICYRYLRSRIKVLLSFEAFPRENIFLSIILLAISKNCIFYRCLLYTSPSPRD